MTDFAPIVHEDRNQLVVLFDKRRIGIDVDDVERESMLIRQCPQRRDHLIAEMAISAAVDGEMRRDYSPTRIDRKAVLSPRRIWNVTLEPVSTFDNSWFS